MVMSLEENIENLIIVGSGPAGYTAAIYAARANLNPLVIEGWAPGGLLQQTTDVENFPGFAQGITGPELMEQMRNQAIRFGARLETAEATSLDLNQNGGIHRVNVDGDIYETKSIILAMGAEHRKLGITGEAELAGRGISWCSVCDAAFFRSVETIMVGGGDSAMEEAIFLAKFSSKVIIVHRRNDFRASKIMIERARKIENIEFLTPFEVEEFVSGPTGSLALVRLKNTENGTLKELEVAGAFISIGHDPQSQLLTEQLELDDEGFVKVAGNSTMTSLAGVFAAGDLVDHSYRQAITAAGTGCKAALDAEWYLRDLA
jgi:thioredoxin reductase (NADPH)